MTDLPAEPTTLGARRTAQVAVLLDEGGHVLSVNSGLAGSGFLGLSGTGQLEFHEQLHPGCDGNCRFMSLWKVACRGLASSDSVEWEIDDPVLGKFLRLNLSRPPSAIGAGLDRRRGSLQLTITDITKHRREYESLIKRERALMRMLQQHGVNPDGATASDIDESRIEEIRALADHTREYRAFNRQEILAQEMERRRIATELHDSLAQSAGVIKYGIEASLEKLSRQQPDLDLSALENLVEQTRALVDEIRRISNNLAPSTLEDFGLCVALKGLCAQFRSADLDLCPDCEACVDESQLPDVVRFTVYRVTQEALNNMAKYSAATTATVRLFSVDGDLHLSIRDDGRGFDLSEIRGRRADGASGAGLRNMRERVVATGGDYSIESAPGEGVHILATWSKSSLKLLSDEAVLYGVDGNG